MDFRKRSKKERNKDERVGGRSLHRYFRRGIVKSYKPPPKKFLKRLCNTANKRRENKAKIVFRVLSSIGFLLSQAYI